MRGSTPPAQTHSALPFQRDRWVRDAAPGAAHECHEFLFNHVRTYESLAGQPSASVLALGEEGVKASPRLWTAATMRQGSHWHRQPEWCWGLSNHLTSLHRSPLNSNPPKVLCVIGTRPEAIKMAPVVLALRHAERWDVKVLATGQHREMLDQALMLFNIKPDLALNVMRSDQTLTALTVRLLKGIDACLEAQRPAIVLAQGDTTTVLATALACFYQKIPFGHVEAGLRTHDLQHPWPEEMNRLLAGHLAAVNFAPTETAYRNLLQEGVDASRVYVTGNTVIDALYLVAEEDLSWAFDNSPGQRMILVTAHRRENFGMPMVSICNAIGELARKYSQLHFLFPVHPNPNVRSVVNRELGALQQVTLCEPLGYGAFVTAMKRAHLLLSDSGGVQEEAPALAKPVLVLRNETERPEAVSEGVVELVGTDAPRIIARVSALLDDEREYNRMATGSSPYGDGRAAVRIESILGRMEDFR